ncbi:MAG: amino acid adenylation domain-containing protein [Acidobacteria bacterium]|nr:amino acid adenylation domain-containing protein [Acidobacteriota bacterium]
MDKKALNYFEQMSFRLHGEIDVKLFEDAFNRLIHRYDSLRTVFTYKKSKKPRQVVLKNRKSTIQYIDLANLKREEITNFVENFRKDDREKGFDLSRDILLRLAILKLKEHEYEIVWSFHHIIMDGWCTSILMREITDIYARLKKGEPVPSMPVPPYSLYIKWLEKQDKKEALNYWETYLENYEIPAPAANKKEVPANKNENTYEIAIHEYETAIHEFNIEQSLIDQLNPLLSESRTTLSTMFQVVWGVFLQEYNDSDDVVFGSVVSGRPANLPGVETMVGLFINTVPVRIKRETGTGTFSSLVRDVQLQINRSRQFDYTPLAEIQSKSTLKRDLLDHIIVFENYPLDRTLEKLSEKPALGFSIINVEVFEQTNYNLNIVVSPVEGLHVVLQYNKQVYDPWEIERIEKYINRVMAQVSENPGIALAEIDIIPAAEKNKILYDLNNTAAEFPGDKTLHALFGEQVDRTPNHIAAAAESMQITYRELHETSNRMAFLLLEKNVQPDTIVAIRLKRSLPMIVSILGILKAGGAYLPIDPAYPQERLDFMLKDSNAKLTINYEFLKEAPQAPFLQHSAFIAQHSNHLCYIIYTSGSTGKPKGVMIEHRGVVDYIWWAIKTYVKGEKANFPLYTSISFDLTVTSIFTPLLSGNAVIIYEGTEKEILLDRVINENRVQIVKATPSHLKLIKDKQIKGETSIKRFIVGGEIFEASLAEALFKVFKGNIEIYNEYGPTETVVGSMIHQYNPILDINGGLPIGTPADNTLIYILSRNKKLLPMGVSGEIYIGGEGVARGYLNRPGLTAEKFPLFPNFLTSSLPNFPLYRTGDLARWLQNGVLEFLGRIDNQVKIRGYRIETGEIEKLLLSCSKVKDALILAREDKNNEMFLCAYYVPHKMANEDTGISESILLKDFLAAKLPDYMVPSYFIQLEKIPLTTNGKIDQKALPLPHGNLIIKTAYEPPRDEVEKILVELWQEVLDIQTVGINDNFFDSGGHSLKAMTFVSNVHKRLNVEIPLNELFKNPTIKGISAYLGKTGDNIYASIAVVEKREYYPLSAAQKRLFIINDIEKDSVRYNIPMVLELKGKLDHQRLENSIKTLLQRHESLRTGFRIINGMPVQVIHENIDFAVEYYNEPGPAANAGAFNTIIHDLFIRPFDLSRPPLVRVGLLNAGAEKNLLLIDIHHIVCDGISSNIILSEIAALYRGQGIPGLTLQYKDYALWQQEMIASGKFKEAEKFWLENLQGEIPVLNLYTDYPRPPIQSPEGSRFTFIIDQELSQKIKTLAGANGATVYMILLTAYNALLYKYTAQEDIIVGTPTAGRPHADLQNILGMFINMLTMRNYPAGEKTFNRFLQEVKENALKVYENQGFQFEELVSLSDLRKDLSRNPLFDTVFAVQNLDVPEIQMPDLRMGRYDFGERTSKYDITLYAYELEQEIQFNINYCTKLFRPQTIEQMSRHFINLLNEIARFPKLKLHEIRVLAKAEQDLLVYEFNKTGAEYSRDMLIHRLFEEQAEKFPDHIAIVGGSIVETLRATSLQIQITYNHLNQQSNRLACLLNEKGVLPDTIAAIMIERSVEMIVGIMGILKSGGAYLPIDPEYPQERIDYILKDSNARVLINKSEARSTKSETNPNVQKINDQNKNSNSDSAFVLNLEHLNLNSLKGCPRRGLSNFDIRASNLFSSNLAYIIYTSGTTGKPKGVLVEHQNVIRLMTNDKFQFNFGNSDVWTMFHSFNFDFSVWEMYGALLYGGKLIIVPFMVSRDPGLFLQLLKEQQVTVLNQTPSAFYNLIDEEIKSTKKELNLRYVIFGGEALKPVKLKKWQEKYPHTTLVNMFGITETTVHVTYKQIGQKEIDSNTSDIGVPIPTMTAYIVDRYINLLPLGGGGELLVGGEGVSRGYLNRPDLTADRFIRPPFKTNERIYRSGDLARFLPGGGMEYLGRIDHQVQLKGFRIELGEIEARLLEYEGITEVVVTAKENDDGSGYRYLCAYIAAAANIDTNRVREYLAGKIPDYMIPHYFVLLEKFPLTVNGKVDRAKLPDPGLNITTEGEYIPPANNVQEKLAEIWCRILQLPRVGITDNYFHVGGESIKAIALLSAINNEFHSNFKIADLYTNQTIAALSLLLEKTNISPENDLKDLLTEITELKEKVLKTIADTGSEPGNIEDILPMSSIEKGMVFHYLKEAGEGIYHDQPVYQVTYKDFDIEKMRKAFGLMMEKHPILRTAYIEEEFAHVIYRQVPLDIPYYDISGLEKDRQREHILSCMRESRRRPFNVGIPPLWRCSFFNIGNQQIVLLWEFHHAIIDGWSNSSLLTELNNTYLQLKNNPGYIPQKLKSGYKEYILQEMQEKRKPGTAAYWKNELFEYKRLSFPRPVPAVSPVNPAGLVQTKKEKEEDPTDMNALNTGMGVDRREKLETLARKYNTTLKHLCFTAHVGMLSMLSYENEFVVGLVAHNRPLSEDGDKIIGCFLNSVPVKINIPWHTGWRWLDFARMIDNKMLELKKYDRLPLFEIVKHLEEKTDEKNPLFDTLFNFIDFYMFRQVQVENTGETHYTDSLLNVESYEKTNFPFSLSINTLMGGFLARFDYNAAILDGECIHKLSGYFVNIIDKLIHDPEAVLDKGSLMSLAEKQQLLIEFNKQDIIYSRDKTIHDLFEEQVKRTPGHTALVDPRPGGGQITYAELSEQFSRLAGLLIEKGVQPNTIVGLIVHRSLEMIIAILGILKAGAAYLPINPKNPPLHTRYMLRDSSIKRLVTTQENRELVANWDDEKNFEIVILNSFNLSSFPASHLPKFQTSDSSNLAYVIYTSGSTGMPKGVNITHSNFSPLIHWGKRQYGIGYNDRFVQNLSYFFDWSVWEIFLALTNGAALYIVPEEVLLSGESYSKFINRNRVTVLHITPSHFQVFCGLESNGQKVKLESLNYLFLGAEKLTNDLLKRSLSVLHSECRIFNMYGPTEATIIASVLEVDRKAPAGFKSLTSVPIGKPVGNTGLYILDIHMNLCPLNVCGELYIGGEGVARGYLNQPELTADRFIYQSPITNHQSPIYKTGDLARWLPVGPPAGGASGGVIEYLGRIDNQVKLRGYRIELGEIENKLLAYEYMNIKIKAAIVIVKGEMDLCAYIVTDGPVENEIEFKKELKEYLAGRLPGYMVPSFIMLIENIPLNPNGKVDLKALPDPEAITDEEYTAPRDKLEMKLVQLWAGLLNIQPGIISIDSSFFELGGHSLKATVLISRVHKELNIKLPLAELFANPTIRGISGYIKRASENIYESIMPVEQKEYYALSFAQQRMYILQQIDLKSTAYNMPYIIPLPGETDTNRLEESFKKLIKRHESLRTSFHMIDEQPMQRVHPEVAFEIEYLAAQGREEVRHFIRTFIRPFDLSKAPLLRVGLVREKEGRHILMADMHHIISDGVSDQVLRADFTAFYQGRELLPLRIQYKDFAQWQNSPKEIERLHQQKTFWLTEFAGEIPVLEIPIDYPRPMSQSFAGESIDFEIPVEAAQRLNTLALQGGATLFMVLTAALNIFLAKLSGQEEIIIGTPIAGRKHADLEKIIGMFVNTLALRNYPVGEQTFTAFLADIKERTLIVFENQEYPFEELVDKLALERDMGRNPLFDVMLVLNNMNGGPGVQNEYLQPATGQAVQPELPEEYKNMQQAAKFDLTFTAAELGRKMLFHIQYCTKLFKQETIQRFSLYFRKILRQISENPGLKLKEIEIILDEEKHQLLHEFNNAEKTYPKDKTIHRLYEEQVERTPDKMAVILPAIGQISYRELENKSNGLAILLREKGAAPGIIAGIMCERSIEMIIGILGILKSGAAYLPLNPQNPPSRTQYMLEDSGAAILLTDFEKEKMHNCQLAIVNSQLSTSGCLCRELHHSSFINHHSNLAYVIYTSGSTGNPKGVPISHANFSPLVHWGYRNMGISEADRFLQNLSYFFDWSVWEIFLALTTGAGLYIAPNEVLLSGEALGTFINENEITVLHITPSQFQVMVGIFADGNPLTLRTLKHLCLGAEKLTYELVKRSIEIVPGDCRIYNMYGPTEATIISSVLAINRDTVAKYQNLSSIPIGMPVGSAGLYILDKYFNLCPFYVTGQLYISGVQLANGYLNRPELTADRFKRNVISQWSFVNGKFQRNGNSSNPPNDQ